MIQIGGSGVILSRRQSSSGCFMPVAWAAENALEKVSGWRVKVLDIARRKYVFCDNRLARNLAAAWPSLKKRVYGNPRTDVFLFLMGLGNEFSSLIQDEDRRKWIYLFDTWEPEWESLERKLNLAKNVHTIYMSSSQAAAHFHGRLPCNVVWLPQAAVSTEFRDSTRDWNSKSNTILNIGRSNRVLDAFFNQFSNKHGWEYIKPEIRGGVHFAERRDFLQALYRSKIVVVHPRNLEYPEATGCVSMLTARYFEAYQSAGVVCGFKPQSGEFERVLGGFPFVEYDDAGQFEESLLTGLNSPERWLAAEQQCRTGHTWESRLSQIVTEIG